MSQFMEVFSKFTKGNKIISPAASIALIAFFMPWVLVSCEGQPIGSFSGWQLANGVSPDGSGSSVQMPIDSSPMLFLVWFAAIGCLAMVFFVYRQQISPRIGAFASFGMAVLSLLIIFMKFLQSPSGSSDTMGAQISLEPRFGLVLTIFAYIGVIVGAVLDVMSTGGWKLDEMRESATRLADQARSSAESMASRDSSATDEQPRQPVDQEKR